MDPTKPSLELLRQLSDRHVLAALIDEPQLTRAQIATRSGLSKPTVGESVRRLVEAGVVRDTGGVTTGRGRAGTLYALADDVGVALAAQARDEQLKYQAFHDALTGLPNRPLLLERLTQEMAHARRSGRQLAVLFIDLDRFKKINDSLGHEAGDRLLCQVAERLISCTREGDTVARLSGDEFIVLLPGLGSPKPAARLAGT